MITRGLWTTSWLFFFTFNSWGQTTKDASLQLRALRLEPFIVESARRYGIDPALLRSVCFVESGFRVGAISPKGARGPMQFMTETATRYGLRNSYDPKAALDAAAHYLRDLLMKFGRRVDLALAAYNSGEGTVQSFLTGRRLVLPSGKVVNPRGLFTGGIPPYPETRRYVNAVLSNWTTTPAFTAPSSSSLGTQLRFRTRPLDFTRDGMAQQTPQVLPSEERS